MYYDDKYRSTIPVGAEDSDKVSMRCLADVFDTSTRKGGLTSQKQRDLYSPKSRYTNYLFVLKHLPDIEPVKDLRFDNR